MASLVASLGVGGGCGGSKPGTGNVVATRAACYPPCLADLVARCPLIGECTTNVEPSRTVPLPGETRGDATCFASGERLRNATDAFDHAMVYVKAPDGSECYAAIGNRSPTAEAWDLSIGARHVAALTWDLTTGALAVWCDGTITEIDVSKPICQGPPWRPTTSCDPGTSCTFGQAPTPGDPDAGMPCDPSLCTTPPAATCEVDSATLRHSIASYDGAPTCTNIDGCIYPKLATLCDHGCDMAQCTGALASITNVQGKATTSSGTIMPVSITGGGVPANTMVTVTARTSPRGAASSVTLRYGTCTASTLCVMSSILFMDVDPSTPAGQSDYEQWTVNVSGQAAGTKLEFQLQATGAGDGSSMISQASLGVPWSYTSN